MRTETQRPRAIVVGATFGAVYAEALAVPQSPVELVGLVSTGSAASVELAQRVGVPLYSSLDRLPDVDLAFVVVRSSVVGGEGTDICAQLLSRGIHVLQEQPVHADEIVSLLSVASTRSALYAVNDFYSHVAPVRQFLSATARLNAVSPIRYVHARSSLQVVYPLFTLLADLLCSLSPARIVMQEPSGGPFAAGRVTLGDVPVDLLIQKELCPSEPDNYARLMHTIVVGSDAGELSLAHTHGSTWWYPRLRATDDPAEGPIAQRVGMAFDPTVAMVRHELWPEAVRQAAAGFLGNVGRARVAVSQRFVHATRLWSDFTSAMGPATLIDACPPPMVSAADLVVR